MEQRGRAAVPGVQALCKLAQEGAIGAEEAMASSTHPSDLRLMLKGFGSGARSLDSLGASAEQFEAAKETEGAANGGRSKVTRGF